MHENGNDAGSLMTLWAKHGKRPGYHPLLYHLLDVAAVALALWDLSLTSRLRQWVQTSLGLSEPDARTWTAFLAGAHDIGKATIAFERQVPAALDRLDCAGFVGPVSAPNHAPHGAVSARELRDLLPAYGMTPRNAERAASVVGAHHGRFHDRGLLNRLPSSPIGDGVWAEARSDLLATLATLLNLPAVAPSTIDTSVAMWLAGLVSVADWIGSDEDFFPWGASDGAVPQFDPAYWHRAQEQARGALLDLGWQAQPASTDEKAFKDLFKYDPNETQQAVRDLAPREQGLVIVEASTGSGKTEAAMWLADNWSRTLGTRGFYIALPTQATSNQMFGRAVEYLRRRYPGEDVNVQLLHGHASLSAEFEALQREDLRRPLDIDAGDGDVLAAEWFTRRKRGLLAPFGVGTVDQLLLAILQTQHLFVRLFGLAGKTVIIDEVHAYDTYMSTLLETSLRWLAALGSPVILLSATLPDSRRRALADAYCDGLGRSPGELAAGPYPRLTWVSETTGPETIAIEPPPNREVSLRWIDESGLGSQLKDALSNGGIAAVICNSVAHAQEIYTALKVEFPPEELDLLHARYPYEERARREERTLARLEKDGERPQRLVLVATQIVEQSLDIDFDLLVTDLPPVDLLLQRIGRLHRHQRENRPVPTAEAWIIRPERMGDGIPNFADTAHAVYSPFILLRTWIVLQGRETVRIPSDIQALVESVYDDKGFPAVSEGIQQRLRMLREEQDAAIDEERRQAWMREIRPPDYTGQLAKVAENPRAEEAPDLHPAYQALTRLADLSIPVVLLTERQALPDGTVVDVSKEPSNDLARRLLGRSVSLASRRVIYDLQKQAVPAGWMKSPLLRNHRVLILPDDGQVHIGSAAVSLDPELGVVIDPWKGAE